MEEFVLEHYLQECTSQQSFDFRSITNNFAPSSKDKTRNENDVTSICNDKPEIELNEIEKNLFFDVPEHCSPVKGAKNMIAINGEVSQLNWNVMTPIRTFPTFETDADLDDVPSILKEETIYNIRCDSGDSDNSGSNSSFTTSTISVVGNNYVNGDTRPLIDTSKEVECLNDRTNLKRGYNDNRTNTTIKRQRTKSIILD